MEIRGGARRVRFGECLLDEGRGVLVAPGGAETVLRPKTFELLALMLANAGRVVTRAEILDAVWRDVHVTDDSITQCVVELRKAMGEGGAALLKTLPRRGYLLQAEVAFDSAVPPPAQQPALSRRADDRPSIVVLPFRMAANDPQDAYFADGIIEGIVHVLSGLDGLFVLSRGSALAFAQTSLDPRAAGRELGVRYVLQGGVRRAGGRLRVTTELSETERGTILRTDRYDGSEADLFEMQDRIAEQAAGVILPQVKAEELARAMRKPPANLSAYDLVLRALDCIQKLTPASFKEARELLARAMAADPDHALAYTHLAWLLVLSIAQGWSDDVAADSATAERMAAEALQRDPHDALAMTLSGFVTAYIQRDYRSSRRMLEQATQTSPSCALAWTYGAAIRCWYEPGQDAVAWAERGLRLAPQDPFTFLHEHILSQAHYTADNYEDAVAWSKRSIASNPSHAVSWRVLMVALVALDRVEEAEAAGREMMALSPGFRLASFAARTPFHGAALETYVTRLRIAGLPD